MESIGNILQEKVIEPEKEELIDKNDEFTDNSEEEVVCRLISGSRQWEKEPEKNVIAKIKEDLTQSKDAFKIAFCTKGKIQHIILLANYIYIFKQMLQSDDYIITVFHESYTEIIYELYQKELIQKNYSISRKKLIENDLQKEYEIVIDMDVYPIVLHKKIDQIVCRHPELIEYILSILEFEMRNSRFVKNRDISEQYNYINTIQNRKCAAIWDVENYLRMDSDLEYHVDRNMYSEQNILEQFGLLNVPYIVLTNETSKKYKLKDNKRWPEVYFDILIEKIKKAYPEITLVFIHEGYFDDQELNNADVHIADCSMRELKALLGNAKLLISNDSYYVYVRKLMDAGDSIVLFTSTNIEVNSFAANVNLRTGKCMYPCERLYVDWQRKCKAPDKLCCQWSLTPNMVMHHIENYLK